jgi:hypothetical protein
MDELEKLVAFMNRFPALRKAFTRMQSTFGDVAEPTDDDLAFITRVRGAPLQIWGRLQRNGRWLITSYLVPTAAKNEDATEAAIADLTEQKILVPRHERVAEALVRFAIPRLLTGNFTPNVEALEVFKRRLAASRFAVASSESGQ